MLPSLDTLLRLLTEYGYALFFLASFVEGPITSVLGGFLSAQGYFNIGIVYVMVVAGDLAGDAFYYGVGYVGSLRPKWFRFLRLKSDQVESFKERFRKHLGKTMFIAKYTQTGTFVLTAAGAARMPFQPFLLYNLLASIPKSIGLILAGYFFGYAYARIDAGIRIFSFAAVGAATLAVIAYVYWSHRRKKRQRQTAAQISSK